MGIFALVIALITALVASVMFFYARKDLTMKIVGALYPLCLQRGKGVEFLVGTSTIIRCVWIGSKIYFRRMVDMNSTGPRNWKVENLEVAVELVRIMGIDLDTAQVSAEAEYMFGMWDLQDRCAEEAVKVAKNALDNEASRNPDSPACERLFKLYKAAHKAAMIQRYRLG